jgi:hypothetical protein
MDKDYHIQKARLKVSSLLGSLYRYGVLFTVSVIWHSGPPLSFGKLSCHLAFLGQRG